MADVTLLGTGALLGDCRAVLQNAGIVVGTDQETDATPVLLGDAPNLYGIARRVVDDGRDLLICNPVLLAPSELQALLRARSNRQAVGIWSSRRAHPANRMIAGLVRAGDPAWEPRLVRSAALSCERPTAALLTWQTIESIALLIDLAGAEPRSVSAVEAPAGERGKEDFAALAISFDRTTASLQVGLGEAVEKRETLLASPTRKAYIDELDRGVPLRILDAETPAAPATTRYVACPAPSHEELVRLQLSSFLDAGEQAALAASEAGLVACALSVWRAAQVSLSHGGAPQPVEPIENESAEHRNGAAATPALRPSLRLLSR
jgi:hypothetical protein